MIDTLDLRLVWAVVRRDLRTLVGSRTTVVPLVPCHRSCWSACP